MRVKSAFKNFFINRLIVKSSVPVVLLTIFSITTSFATDLDRDARVKHVNLMIRQIGHRLLLQSGDSTSRVLPVTETKDGTFVLPFEKAFVFNHDSLMALSQGLLPKTQFPSGYIVTVHDCLYEGIVYGFQLSNTSPDVLACKGRSQPPGCYVIEFAFPDFYETTLPNEVEPKNTRPKKAVPVVEEQKKPDYENLDHKKAVIHQLTEEHKTFKVDREQADPKPQESETTTLDAPASKLSLVFIGMLVVLGVALLIARFGKSFTSVPAQDQNPVVPIEPVAGLPALGKFSFDVKGQRLLSTHEVISLTDKECKILELLNNNFGELIPRETLMQQVWFNEGVITGRSLDMFISKLRKKLSHDPALKITNVHGKGYRLQIP